jgi:small subunit ribosomal protein S16
MLKIRLQRVGRKNDPSFRLVVVDSHYGPQSGKFLEVLGNYNARGDRKIQFKIERVKHWLKEGAKASDTVHNLLVSEKVIEGKKINVLPKKKPIKKDDKEGLKEKGGEEVKQKTQTEAPKETEILKAEEKKEEVSKEAPKEENKG